MTAEKFKSIEIDLEKGVYKLNGKEMTEVSDLRLSFSKGEWSLMITKDMLFETVPKEKARGQARLSDLVAHLEVEGLDEAKEKMEKMKDLMAEINALYEKTFKG